MAECSAVYFCEGDDEIDQCPQTAAAESDKFQDPKTCLTSHKAIDTKRAKEKIPYPCKDVFIHMLFFCYIYISNVDVYILRLWLRHQGQGRRQQKEVMLCPEKPDAY